MADGSPLAISPVLEGVAASRPRRVSKHGTWNEYTNYGCRCDTCREAAIIYQRAYQATPCAADCGRTVWGRFRPGTVCRTCMGERMSIPLAERHGTELGYKKGCRCRQCRAASTAARRRRRQATR